MCRVLSGTIAVGEDEDMGVDEVMDEGMECVESGSWSMEPADSKSVGTVSWDLEKTNCAGRESGGTTRAEFSFDGGDYSMKMR